MASDLIGFRYLTDVQGMDGYAAREYMSLIVRRSGEAIQTSMQPLASALRRVGEAAGAPSF